MELTFQVTTFMRAATLQPWPARCIWVSRNPAAAWLSPE